ncbi:DUF2206 domain-containing protein [Methanothermobacter sp.]|uniref:DUF2206 domain-containing protein n=1 Tax=Methanothermobacter sp. TaxID=1884223 RepID=UPI00261EFFC3|nr:DUF2206 domain-containing protein [Methanothermobacter sp.]MDI9615101.1 DUF2206 domain-containing protein [Methanothermobacter sp.]
MIGILKLRLKLPEFIVFSIGLSVSFLMFAGLIINYLPLARPLGLRISLLSLNFFILVLLGLFFAKVDSQLITAPNTLKNEKWYLIILPFIFPFLSVIGAYYMNVYGGSFNFIIVSMLIAMIVFVLFIVSLEDVPPLLFPFSIWMMGLSLLLMNSLVSNYIGGFNDLTLEYYVARLTFENQEWSISLFQNPYNACLSITILPALLSILTGLNLHFIFKFVHQFIFSITPLVVYLLFQNYLSKKEAFIAAFFFMAQIPFIESMYTHTRTELAIMFVALSLFILFVKNQELEGIKRKLLFVPFIFCIILSHYSTAYVFFFMLVGALLVIQTRKYFDSDLSKKNVLLTSLTAFLFFSFLFLWYGQVTAVPFSAGVEFINKTFENLFNFFVLDLRGETELKVLGAGVSGLNKWISVIVHDITFVMVTVGTIFSLVNYRKSEFQIEYLAMSSVGLILLLFQLLLPYISIGFSAIRLYQIALVLLAPFFLKGGHVFNLMLKDVNFSKKKFVLIILILQFICATSLIYFNTPNLSYVAISEESCYHLGYIYDCDIAGSFWLIDHGNSENIIFTDFMGDTRLICGGAKNTHKIALFNHKMWKLKKFIIISKVKKQNIVKNDYVYLHKRNLINKELVTDEKLYPKPVIPLSTISSKIKSTNKVYDNGGSNIFIGL